MVERLPAGARDDRLLAAGREKSPQAEEHPGVVVDHEHPRHRRPPAMIEGSIDTDRTPAARDGTAANGRLPASPTHTNVYGRIPGARYRPSREWRQASHRRRLRRHAAVVARGGAHRTQGHHGPGAR